MGVVNEEQYIWWPIAGGKPVCQNCQSYEDLGGYGACNCDKLTWRIGEPDDDGLIYGGDNYTEHLLVGKNFGCKHFGFAAHCINPLPPGLER
jgi:hypothetical protein